VKLSEDRARRLTRLVRRERLRRWLPIAAAGLAVVSLLVFMFEWRISHADRTVEVRMHDATVLNAKRTASRGMTILHVHLDDGRDVDALSLLPLMLVPGAHVVVSEARQASGHLTWDVVRAAER
jgi:hypothetical protein